MALRALRGATRLQADDPAEMTAAVVELLTTIFERNQLSSDQLVSMIFTATPDLVCMFPAAAARGRRLGCRLQVKPSNTPSNTTPNP